MYLNYLGNKEATQVSGRLVLCQDLVQNKMKGSAS